MMERSFYKLSWGIFFIMIDFRLLGFDVFPDIVGYILFAQAIKSLIERSSYFKTAENINIAMIFLSVFSIWEIPVQAGIVTVNILGPFSLLFAIAVGVLNLVLMYFIFAGIKDIALQRSRIHFVEEADTKFRGYLAFQLASMASIIMVLFPVFAFFYVIGMFIIGIVLTVVLMRFFSSCGECLE